MSTWPASLPQSPLVQGYSEVRDDPVLRTAMDIGPDKARRRYTAVATQFNISLLLTETQLGTLETFFTDTLLDGAESFDWPHPRTGSTVTARFKGPYSIATAGCDYYTVRATLEELP